MGAILPASAGGIGGSTGSTDNAGLRADGTGGATLQASALLINDRGEIAISNADGGGQFEVVWTSNICVAYTNTSTPRNLIVAAINGGAITFATNGDIFFSKYGTADYWKLDGTTHELSALAAYDFTTTGFVKAKLQTSTAATTGLTPGVFAATTDATLVFYDSTGQRYKVAALAF